MASGMCPCWADVVREELLEQLCPNELKEFKEALLASDITEGEFCQAWRSKGSTPPEKEHVTEREQVNYAPYRSLQNLIEAFKDKTGGLELDICYHDPENGDCYDEVYGLFFIPEPGSYTSSITCIGSLRIRLLPFDCCQPITDSHSLFSIASSGSTESQGNPIASILWILSTQFFPEMLAFLPSFGLP